MATISDKPIKGEVIRRWLDFAFGFKNRKGEVISYWIYSADGFSLPPREFYDTVEQHLAARKIPDMEITRQEFAEGGTLSDQRLYLRLMRERLAITTCAAPFGSLFFFSCRTVYVPALVRLWHILALLLFLVVLGGLLVPALGMTFALVAVVTLLFAVAAVFRNASAKGFSNLDTLLLAIPVVSTIYEDWFRENTYYREDTRNLYMKVLPDLIRESAEEVCAAKGVKLEPHIRHMPMVADLYQPIPSVSSQPEV